MFPPPPLKLHDCTHHGIGSGAELYIVEGDSAAGSVAQVRNGLYQAVLPMQGKPLNTVRATTRKVHANPWFKALVDALGAGVGDAFDLTALRYDRVILLMDADADGIHCGALAMMFFHRWMRPMLDDGRVGIALAPVATVMIGHPDTPEYVEQHPRSEYELRELIAAKKLMPTNVRRYRGLAGTNLDVLDALCIHPATRTVRRITAADADAAIAAFGRG